MRRVLVAGLLGGVVLVAWVFVIDGVLGVKRAIEMDQLPDERLVYDFLREHVATPGRYVCNPALTPAGVFPGEEPVYGIQYSGLGHDAAGREVLLSLAIFLITPVLGAWLLSRASTRTLSSYPRKVLFFAVLGTMVGLFGDLTRYGIGGYSLGDALALAARDGAAWVAVGMAVAWRIRPEERSSGVAE